MFHELIYQNIGWYSWRLSFTDLKKELLGLARFNPVFTVGGTNCIAIGYNAPIFGGTNCIAIGGYS